MIIPLKNHSKREIREFQAFMQNNGYRTKITKDNSITGYGNRPCVVAWLRDLNGNPSTIR